VTTPSADRPAEYAYVSVVRNMAHAEPITVVHEVGPFADVVGRNMGSYLPRMARADRFDPNKRDGGDAANPFVTDYVRSASVRTSYVRPATDADYPRAFSLYNYETGRFERRKPFAGGE
jgi:hypothetical protein